RHVEPQRVPDARRACGGAGAAAGPARRCGRDPRRDDRRRGGEGADGVGDRRGAVRAPRLRRGGGSRHAGTPGRRDHDVAAVRRGPVRSCPTDRQRGRRGVNGTDLDLLVLGSGVAGLSAAVRAAEGHGLRTGVVTKGGLDLATTRWAQGGVAAALSGDPEEIDLHLADTLAAGAGLCDVDAVRVLVDEGPRRVEELIALGAEFDRDESGNLELAREGGHSVPRIVHAGGAATGAEIERALVAAVRETAAVVREHTFVLDLLVEDGRCHGARIVEPTGEVRDLRARHVLLATGGAGQLYAVTTNPRLATGDGVAMALRAGVAVADLEFF